MPVLLQGVAHDWVTTGSARRLADRFMDEVAEAGVCVLTGAPSKQRVLFAKAY